MQLKVFIIIIKALSVFWETNGRDHCDSVFNDPERYSYFVNEFFEDILSGDIYKKPKAIIIRDPDE